MRTNLSLLALWPVATFGAAVCPPSKGFSPDNGNVTWDGTVNNLPLSFNLSDSQRRREDQGDGLFWVNSFLHGSDGHDYYVASHAMNYASDIPGALPMYRASLLDITDPSYYHNYIRFAPTNASFWTTHGDLNVTFEGYGMETTSKDPLQGIRTYSSIEGIDFDLTFNFTSPVLLNAALGSYWVGGGLGWEWAIPRAITQGTLKIDDKVIDVIPEKSFTWYDRQWGSLSDSFDWLMIHFEESDWLDISLISTWSWTDAVNGPKRFATIRSSKTGRDTVVPTVSLTPSSTNIWTSPETGRTYPQEWMLVIDDIEIVAKSPRPGQVIEAPPETGFPSQFSGYVEVVAKKAGYAPVRGFGAADHMMIA